MSDAVLAGFVVTYAAALAAGSWLAERLPAAWGRGGGPVTPWAREEVVRFRRGMARAVRLVAAFLLVAVLVRFRATAWSWTALLLLVALGGADVFASRRALRRTRGPSR